MALVSDAHRRRPASGRHNDLLIEEPTMVRQDEDTSGRRHFLRATISGLAWCALARPHAAGAQATAGSKQKIGMVGAGREGGALGKLFAKAGYPVMFSSRNPDNLKQLVADAGPLT